MAICNKWCFCIDYLSFGCVNLFQNYAQLPLLDDAVDVLLSRDTDSPIIQREVDAVHEWLGSNRIFHLMRDHPFQISQKHNFPILAGKAMQLFTPQWIRLCDIHSGMWGVKLTPNEKSRYVQAAENMFSINHCLTHYYDQILLRKHLWPVALTSLVIVFEKHGYSWFVNHLSIRRWHTTATSVGNTRTQSPFLPRELIGESLWVWLER